AIAIGTLEITIMIVAGYLLGLLLGWGHINSIFLGAVLSISSTAVIAKTLADNMMLDTNHAKTIIGILIIEDIAAVIILTLLASVVVTGSADIFKIILQLVSIAFFLIVTIAIGTYIVPKVVDYSMEQFPEDVVIILLLGLCFGMAMFAYFANLSTAIGAFVMGVAVSESKYVPKIIEKIKPLSSMFIALFFLSMGMLIAPTALINYSWQIAIFALAFIVFKFFGVSIGSVLLGNKGKDSVRTGLGMLAMGEFSFVIAKVGTELGVVNSSLYPITLGTALITMLIFPFLIARSENFTTFIQSHIPPNIFSVYHSYERWVRNLTKEYNEKSKFSKRIKLQIRRIVVSGLVILILITILRIMVEYAPLISRYTGLDLWLISMAIWISIVLMLIPTFYNLYQKLSQLSSILFEATLESYPKLKNSARTKIFNFIQAFMLFISVTFLMIVLTPILGTISYIGILYVIPFLVILTIVGKLTWSSIINAHNWLDMVLTRTIINEEKTSQNKQSEEALQNK
ncbi:MAG: cation:proton antiporter, partial [Thermoplasmata archaeon]